MKKILVFSLLLLCGGAFAQKDYNCYPSNWWTGMKWNKYR
jgi:hypothetical protein